MRSLTGLLLLLAVMLLCLGAVAPGGSALADEPDGLIAPRDECAAQDEPDASDPVQLKAMLCLVDYARRQAGLGSVTDVRELDWSADAKAWDILRCDNFSHYACGREFTFWMREAGYIPTSCWRAGENLALGAGPASSARRAFIALMNSPEHRRNILGRFDRIGLGLRVGRLDGRKTHVWVQHFGTHCNRGRA
jgi:uncharacterized protein YkwD